MKFWVTSWIFGDFEERLKDIDDDLLKVIHESRCFVHIIQTRNLNKPSDVGRKEFVVHDPGGKLIPFLEFATVDRYTPFYHLVFAGLQVRDNLFGDFCEVSAVDKVVRLQKNGSKP